MNVFDVKTLRAKGGIDKETGYKLDGDYFRPALALLRHARA